MIRRDFIMRMIEEFIQAIARLNSLKRAQRWEEVATALDEEFSRLIGAGSEAVGQLSETELQARVMDSSSTQAVRQKTGMLVALLDQAAQIAATQGRAASSREFRLKALHLLLNTLAQGELFEFPDFVPKVESLKGALQEAPLPLRTHALLMQHYERAGEFAKAEDALFAMTEAQPDQAGLAEFGESFYRRMRLKSDAELAAGQLPRAEVEEGLKEFQNRAVTTSGCS